MIEIRAAKISDVEWVFAECKEFSAAYPSKFSLAANEPHLIQFITNLVLNHLVLIAEKDGVKAGFISGFVYPHHFNPHIKQLSEVLWWVPPKFRMTGVGAKLFLGFVDYGKKNCDCVVMTIEKDTPLTDEALEKRGFKLTEKAYLLECN